METPTYTITVNGLMVEIYEKAPGELGINTTEPDDYIPKFWKNKKVYIYDALNDLSDRERGIIMNYIYDEGFIDDRRVDCEVIKGEDYL